jgi:hypothetical protein
LITGASFLHSRKRRPGKLRLDVQDARSVRVRLCHRLSAQCEQLGNVIGILLAQLHTLGIRLQVVVAIRQAESAGTQLRNHDRRVDRILARAGAKEVAAWSIVVQLRNGRQKFGPRTERIDAGKRRLDGPIALGVDRFPVHARLKVVAHLLLNRCAVHSLGVLFQDAPQKLLVLIGELGVDIPRSLISRNRVQRLPPSADILVEVHAWIHAAIHAGEIERRRVRHLRERLRSRLLGRTSGDGENHDKYRRKRGEDDTQQLDQKGISCATSYSR